MNLQWFKVKFNALPNQKPFCDLIYIIFLLGCVKFLIIISLSFCRIQMKLTYLLFSSHHIKSRLLHGGMTCWCFSAASYNLGLLSLLANILMLPVRDSISSLVCFWHLNCARQKNVNIISLRIVFYNGLTLVGKGWVINNSKYHIYFVWI